uniref:Uncharacterized protein n=1 Tax=Trichogramma kaykai TaxID=54128 RepID=A0ABD2W751_9HYME
MRDKKAKIAARIGINKKSAYELYSARIARGPEKNVLCIARGARASLARGLQRWTNDEAARALVGQRKTPESRVGRDIRYISPLQPFSSTVHTHTATGWQGAGLASTSAKINMDYVPRFEEYIYSRVKQNIIHVRTAANC